MQLGLNTRAHAHTHTHTHTRAHRRKHAQSFVTLLHWDFRIWQFFGWSNNFLISSMNLIHALSLWHPFSHCVFIHFFFFSFDFGSKFHVHVIKTYGEVEVQLHIFLVLTLDSGAWSPLLSGQFIQEMKLWNLTNRCVGGLIPDLYGLGEGGILQSLSAHWT